MTPVTKLILYLWKGWSSKDQIVSDELSPGPILAPTLFNLYICDVENAVLCDFINADDIALVACGKDLTSISDILSTVLKGISPGNDAHALVKAFHLGNKAAKESLSVIVCYQWV